MGNRKKAYQTNNPLGLAIGLSLSLWVFAALIGLPLPWKLFAFPFLVLAALIFAKIFHSSFQTTRLSDHFELNPKALGYTLLLSLIAAIMAIYLRKDIGLSNLPNQLGAFAGIAVAIGMMEEVIFRGFVQEGGKSYNPKIGIGLAALAHGGYKTLLFVFSPDRVNSELIHLFGGTFLAGLVLGAGRHWSGSLLPVILAHGLFDLIYYGEQDTAPWWVW